MKLFSAEEKGYDPSSTKDREDLSTILALHGEALFEEGQCLLYLGKDGTSQINSSLSSLEVALKLAPYLPRNHFILGSIQMEQGEFEIAQGHFVKALSSNPNNTDVLGALGKNALNLDSPDIAVSYLERVSKINPDEGSVLYCLGIALYRIDDFKRAISVFEEHKRKFNSGNDPELLYYLGMCYLSIEDSETAQKCFEDSISHDPETSMAYHPLAMLYYEMERIKDADSLIETAVAIDSEDDEILMDAGLIKIALDQPEEAYDYFMEAYEINPRHPDVHFFLGESQFMRENYGDALSYYLVADALQCEQENLQLRIGECHFYSGNLEEAEVCFRDIVTSDPQNSTARYHLARVYQDMKKYDYARRLIEEAFEMNPEDEDIAGLHDELCDDFSPPDSSAGDDSPRNRLKFFGIDPPEECSK